MLSGAARGAKIRKLRESVGSFADSERESFRWFIRDRRRECNHRSGAQRAGSRRELQRVDLWNHRRVPLPLFRRALAAMDVRGATTLPTFSGFPLGMTSRKLRQRVPPYDESGYNPAGRAAGLWICQTSTMGCPSRWRYAAPSSRAGRRATPFWVKNGASGNETTYRAASPTSALPGPRPRLGRSVARPVGARPVPGPGTGAPGGPPLGAKNARTGAAAGPDTGGSVVGRGQ
jgi:hypothetical protein